MLGSLKPERSRRLSLSLRKLVVRVVRVAPTAIPMVRWGGVEVGSVVICLLTGDGLLWDCFLGGGVRVSQQVGAT